MDKEKVASRINDEWNNHLEGYRLKILMELGEEWVLFLENIRFSDPHVGILEYIDMIKGYKSWEITIYYPDFLKLESDTFTLGKYEYSAAVTKRSKYLRCTKWLVNGKRKTRNYVEGLGAYEFLTSDNDLRAESVFNDLLDEFNLKERIIDYF